MLFRRFPFIFIPHGTKAMFTLLLPAVKEEKCAFVSLVHQTQSQFCQEFPLLLPRVKYLWRTNSLRVVCVWNTRRQKQFLYFSRKWIVGVSSLTYGERWRFGRAISLRNWEESLSYLCFSQILKEPTLPALKKRLLHICTSFFFFPQHVCEIRGRSL